MANIVFYFSGTGNSLVVARCIAAALEDCRLVSMGANETFAFDRSYERVGFVYPVYYAGLPERVMDFVGRLNLSGAPYLFSVATYGAGSSNGVGALQGVLKKKGRRLDYGENLVMPGNYLFLYGRKPVADRQLAEARARIPEIAAAIGRKDRRTVGGNNPFYSLLSRYFVRTVRQSARKYTVDDGCNGCSLCSRICPVGNIEMAGERPVFGPGCQQCMACFQFCPKEAIARGKGTRGRARYTHPEATAQMLMECNSRL